MKTPHVLIGLDYFIALGYTIAAINLVYASVLAYNWLVRSDKRTGLNDSVALVLGVLWVGAALFLVGCGWHHVQHAEHLKLVGCGIDLCAPSRYVSALLQSAGEVLAIGSAVFLISLVRPVDE